MSKKRNPHWGSTLDEFLDEEGIREAARPKPLRVSLRGNSARK